VQPQSRLQHIHARVQALLHLAERELSRFSLEIHGDTTLPGGRGAAHGRQAFATGLKFQNLLREYATGWDQTRDEKRGDRTGE